MPQQHPDTPVIVAVASAKLYGVEAFLCNPSTGAALVPSKPFSQGDLVSVCVRPDAAARADGVTIINRIESFAWRQQQLQSQQGNGAADAALTQEAVAGGSVTTGGLSEYSCASPLKTHCSVTSILLAGFFRHAGGPLVEGVGAAFLEFGDDGDNDNSAQPAMIAVSDFSVSIGGGGGGGSSSSSSVLGALL